MNYLQIVSKVTGIEPKQIMSRNRTKPVAEDRQLCMYFYKNKYGLSETACIMHVNHGTVYSAVNKINGFISISDKRIMDFISEIKKLEVDSFDIDFYFIKKKNIEKNSPNKAQI